MIFFIFQQTLRMSPAKFSSIEFNVTHSSFVLIYQFETNSFSRLNKNCSLHEMSNKNVAPIRANQ